MQSIQKILRDDYEESCCVDLTYMHYDWNFHVPDLYIYNENYNEISDYLVILLGKYFDFDSHVQEDIASSEKKKYEELFNQFPRKDHLLNKTSIANTRTSITLTLSKFQS